MIILKSCADLGKDDPQNKLGNCNRWDDVKYTSEVIKYMIISMSAFSCSCYCCDKVVSMQFRLLYAVQEEYMDVQDGYLLFTLLQQFNSISLDS